MVLRCWEHIGGFDGVLFGKAGGPFHADPSVHLRARRKAVQAFYAILKGWPRAEVVGKLTERYTLWHDVFWGGMIAQTLEVVEKVLWRFYTQTVFDYRLRDPILPLCRPPLPPALACARKKDI